MQTAPRDWLLAMALLFRLEARGQRDIGPERRAALEALVAELHDLAGLR